MQPEVSTSGTTSEEQARAGAAEIEAAIQRPASMAGIGQTIGRYLQQPMVIASMLMASIGALVGIRVAQVQAEQRRRAFYQRWMQNLGSLAAIMLAPIRFRQRQMLMQQLLQERGRGVAEMTRGWGGLFVTGVPRLGIYPARRGGPMYRLRQWGSLIGLIPVALTLMRNPVVRDMGLRVTSLAVRPRARREIGYNISRLFARR